MHPVLQKFMVGGSQVSGQSQVYSETLSQEKKNPERWLSGSMLA